MKFFKVGVDFVNGPCGVIQKKSRAAVTALYFAMVRELLCQKS